MREVISLQTTIFLLVWIGYVVKKRKIIGSQGQKNLTDLVIYVILPCNILKAFMAGQAGEHLKDYLVILGILHCDPDFLYILRKNCLSKRSDRKTKMSGVRYDLFQCGIFGKSDRGGSLRSGGTGSGEFLFDSAAYYDVVCRTCRVYREYRSKGDSKKSADPSVYHCLCDRIDPDVGENKTARRNRWSDLGIGEL